MMSGSRPIGDAAGAVLVGLVQGGGWLFRSLSQSRTQEDAARQARENERASREQQRKWYETVAREHARGKAGFANEREAREALRGAGGRPSKLDDRWF